jgi:tetratricopeptide (TPR) repeat protein
MAPSRDKILKEAEKLVQRGKVEQAIREYEKLLKQNPNDANTINRVGDLYGRVGQIDKAVALYERIAEHFTQDGFTTKAIAILKKINRLAPQRLDVFEHLAELYIQQGLIVEAKGQYQILADWYVKSGNHDKAIETHEKLVQLDPNNHMAHLRLADLLMQSEQPAKALDVYDRLGRVLLEREKLDEAERLYRHALDQDPPTGEFLAPLCEALLESGRTAAAREFLLAAVQRSQDSRVLQVLEVRTHLAFDEGEKALEKANEVLAASPDDAEVRSLVARAMLSSGEVEKARDLLLPFCEQLLDQGEFGAAQKLLQELLQSLPQDGGALNLAVRAYRPSGDQEILTRLIASLADVYFSNEQFDQAQDLYMELLESQPQDDLFRDRLAQIQGVEPDQVIIEAPLIEEAPPTADAVPAAVVQEEAPAPAPQAAAPVVEAGAVDSGEIDPDERLAEAKVFAKYGLLEKATSHLEEIIKFSPDQVEARAILVSLYVEQDETEAALPVARPLYQHYLETSDTEAVQALLASLPELETEEVEVAAPTELEDEIVVLDLDEAIEGADVAVAAVEEAVPDELEQTFEAEPPVAEEVEPLVVEEAEPLVVEEVEPPDAEEVEPPVVEEVAEPAAAVVASDELEQEFVIDLDAEMQPAFEEVLPAPPVVEHEAAEEIVSVARAEDLVEDEEEIADELVEISSSFTGPSVSDLDQLDFFIEQDLHEDAIRLLGKMESEFPEDPEVAERRLALKAKGVLLEEVVAVADEPEELFADEEESYIDLAKELEAEMAEEEAMVDEATGRGKEEALLDEVFREFQKGVAEQLSDADTETHFNLGIAYKEMGLLPEAIREFQVSSRDPKLFVECCSMIGVCYVEQGMWTQAADWYEKALQAPDLELDARLALSYDLASTFESAGESQRAAELFEEIASSSPGYRDVTSRLDSLGEQRQAN